MNFILGPVIIFVGALLVIKSEWFLNNFGRIQWFEEKLGAEGGSRLGYKLTGLAVIFIGVLTMTGLIGGFLQFILSPITRYSK